MSTKFGFGLMDAAGLVNLAKEWETTSEQQICTQLANDFER